MGYIAHHAIFVTGCGDDIKEAHAKALEIFSTFTHEVGVTVADGARLVTALTRGVTNGYQTFVIVPDGSKEGWSDSAEGDRCRDELISWLKSPGVYVDWALIRYDDYDYDHAFLADHNGAEPSDDES